MANPAEQGLLEAASLDAVFPHDSNESLSDLLDTDIGDASSDSVLNVQRRSLLFVDEKVKCLAVLQLPKCDEGLLRSLVQRVDLNLDVWCLDSSQHDDQANQATEPVKDLIYSTKVPTTEEPIVLVQQDANSQQEFLTLVWEVWMVLPRPRIRIPEPAISVQSILLVAPSASESMQDVDMLAPFKLQEPNVLQPLQQFASSNGEPVYLAASRLERVVPPAPKASRHFRTEQMSSRYKIVPAAVARMRFTKMNSNAVTPPTIASLDLEIIPFVEVEAKIEEVHVRIANGTITNLMPDFLPVACHSRDLVTLLYRLEPADHPSPSATPVTPGPMANLDLLTISISITVTTSNGCHSTIEMNWTTNVDFSQALNPTFGAPTQPLQRTRRPQTLSLSSTLTQPPRTVSTSLQPLKSGPGLDSATITFISSDDSVELGKPFSWKILIVNRTTKQAKFTIIPLARVPRAGAPVSHFQKRHAPKSSTASFHPTERRHVRDAEADVEFAQAVVDENVVYAMQHSNVVPPDLDLMSLTAELRVGPLGPGQCHETEIEFVAFKTGVLRVDAIRVIDNVKEADEGMNAPGVVTDIQDLPDIVVARSQGDAGASLVAEIDNDEDD